MFLAGLKEGKPPLKNLIDSLKKFLNEATWDCNLTGMKLEGFYVDGTRAVFHVSVCLEADGFDLFVCGEESSMVVNLDSMSQILEYAVNDETITITRAQERGNIVTFTIKKANGAAVPHHLDLGNPSDGYWVVDKTEYASVIKMDSGEFQRIVRDLSQNGERVVINCSTQNRIRFTSTDDKGEVKTMKDVTVEAVTFQKPVTLTFASKYLKMLFSCWSKQVTLSMSNDIAVVEFNIGEIGHIKYTLAPLAITEKAAEVWQTRGAQTLDPNSDEVKEIGDEVFRQGQAALKDIGS